MKKFRSSRYTVSLVCFLLAMALLFGAVRGLREDAVRQQRQALEEAISKSLLLCYSLEGRYPDTVEELTEKYRLVYDRDRFVIDYRLQGGNLLPDITILEK